MLRAPAWRPEVREAVERALASRPDGRSFAALDLDNTILRGDLGDCVLAHLLERGQLSPPADPSGLTRAALEALASSERATAIAHLALRGTLPGGEAGFTVARGPAYHASYAFAAQAVCQGRTPEALRAIAAEALAEALARSSDREEIAGVTLDRSIRFEPLAHDLARALASAGIEVWVVSASPQPVVEAAVSAAGIPAAGVIGARMQLDGAHLSSRFAWYEGGLPIMTWSEGKPRWMERVIGSSRSILAAGDSEGDLFMLAQAAVPIVIDRGASPLRDRALRDRWLLQPPSVDLR